MSLTHEKKKKSVRKMCTKYTTNQLEKQTTVQSHRSTNQRHSWTIVLPGIGQQVRLSAKKTNWRKKYQDLRSLKKQKRTSQESKKTKVREQRLTFKGR